MELVTLDLDGTLVETTVFQAAADGLGFGDEVAGIDERFFAGELSLEETFEIEYQLFLDHPVQAVHDALARGPWLSGIEETVERLRAAGRAVWVVTDQPSWAVAYLERFGLREGVYTQAATPGDRVGEVTDQVFEKWPALAAKLDQAGIDPAGVCHVGNGTNDIPIFQRVGLGIAFNPSRPSVAACADAVVRSKDLRDILEHIPDAGHKR